MLRSKPPSAWDDPLPLQGSRSHTGFIYLVTIINDCRNQQENFYVQQLGYLGNVIKQHKAVHNH